MNVKKFIDLHVHIGPEILPRKYNVSEIIKNQTGKLKGLVLKSHFYPTMPFIKSVKVQKNLIVIGSVTLNNYVGGLNPDAIYGSAKISDKPIIVWFPTINAENFLRKNKYEIPLEWTGGKLKSRLSKQIKGIKILDKKGNLTIETIQVLKAIKENNCILATGHISWKESKKLVEKAVRIGIKRIIITHPIYYLIKMPIKIQMELAKKQGVYIEQTYAMFLVDRTPIKKIAEQIKKIGAKKCIITSDMGQINNPDPDKVLKEFTNLLEEQGITRKELRIMGEINPKKIITYLNQQKLNKSSNEALK